MKGNYWKISYLVIALFATWSNHRSRIWNGFGLEATRLRASDIWGWSDPGSYLKTGASLLSEHELSSEFHWVANLWTLGMPAMNAGSMFLVGLDGQFLIPLLLLALFLWYQVFRGFSRLCHNLNYRPAVADISISCFLLTPLFRKYLIGQSLIYSDGFATILFISCIILSLHAGKFLVQQLAYNVVKVVRAHLIFLGIGVCLGLLTLFRNQYFFSVQFMLIPLILMPTIYVAFIVVRKDVRGLGRERNRSFWNLIIGIFLILVGSLIVVGPYMSWKANEIGDVPWDVGGRYTLTSSATFAVASNWGPRESKPNFIRDGGGGTACQIDLALCDEIQRAESEDATPWNLYDDEPYTATEFRSLMMTTFYNHPIEWAVDRIPFFVDFFGRNPLNNRDSGLIGIAYTIIVVILGLSGLISFLVRNFKLRRDVTAALAPVCVILALFFGVIIPPFFAHFETRYLVPMRAVFLLFAFAFISEICGTYLFRKAFRGFNITRRTFSKMCSRRQDLTRFEIQAN